MTDIHALIRKFLQQQTVVHLAEAKTLPSSRRYIKAGVVPFMRPAGQGEMVFYVVKPRSTLPDFGEPPFQICKGTRQHLVPGVGWCDMHSESSKNDEEGTEHLAETALREGIEELGLKLENILSIFDMGGFGFSSVTTGKAKQMWLFASEMADEDEFLPDRDIALTTAGRQWMTAKEFAACGRDDHLYILPEIEARLVRYFKERGE